MATDPPKSLAPKSIPAAGKNGLPLSEPDLADFSLRELLGMLLSSVGLAERKAYLQRLLHEQPNGFYDRSLQLGTMPLDVRVPRTRSGDFRPTSLPPLYQRGYSDETQPLLLSLLTSARSLNAVKDALQKMGLSSSQQELEAVAAGLIEELDRRAAMRACACSHRKFHRSWRAGLISGSFNPDKGTIPEQAQFVPYLKGYVAFYAGDYKAALEELNKANQNDPFIQCMMGQTYEKLGEKDKAMEYYRKASTASSHNPPAAYAVPFARKKLS
jgi:tetratricopeptide (TPR) repeat protein